MVTVSFRLLRTHQGWGWGFAWGLEPDSARPVGARGSLSGAREFDRKPSQISPTAGAAPSELGVAHGARLVGLHSLTGLEPDKSELYGGNIREGMAGPFR